MTTGTAPTPLPTAARPSLLPGVLAGLLAAATFGSSGIAAKPLLEAGWTAGAVVLVRIGVAALLLLPIAVWQLRGRWRLLRARAGSLVLFGVFGVAAAQLCYFNAVQHLSVGVALLLEYSGVLLVVAWQWLRSRVAPAAATLLGAVVAVLGLALVLDVVGGAHVDPIGVLWGLGAAVGLAIYFVVGARTDSGLPTLVVVTSGLVVGLLTTALTLLVGLLPVHAATARVTLAGAQLPFVVPLLWLSLVTALLAYLAGIVATRRLGSTMASFFGLTEVLFAVLFAWLLLGEMPTGVQLVGGALVLGGVALVRWGEYGPRKQAVDPLG